MPLVVSVGYSCSPVTEYGDCRTNHGLALKQISEQVRRGYANKLIQRGKYMYEHIESYHVVRKEPLLSHCRLLTYFSLYDHTQSEDTPGRANDRIMGPNSHRACREVKGETNV